MTTAYTAVNVKTGTPSDVKTMPQHVTTQIVSQAVDTSFAVGDTISGPILPAGAYLWDLILDVTDIDSGSTCLLDVGIPGTAQKFLAASTVGQAGGVVHGAKAGMLGYSPTSNTPILVTCNATANTAAAGTVIIGISYTMDP